VPVDDLRVLEFDHVTFTHQTASMPALTDVSFRVQRGETIAFVGPSGAGKSTLVKLLVGLYAPKVGRILYNGVESTRVNLDRLRERIGLVTQETQLFSGSIRENLLFARPGASDAECLAVLHQAAADGLLRRADRGLDTVIGEGGMKISGGEKQRLAIARTLLRDPRVLVLDEATSALDTVTEGAVQAALDEASRGRTTITIAHRLSTVRDADSIVVLDAGRVVEQGTHEELLERGGRYARLAGIAERDAVLAG